jgi:hypothetical protein
MILETTKDLFYLALSIAAVSVAGFLCWGLYELARLMRQANEMVTDTRERINRVEHALSTIREKLESSVNYLGVFATGFKTFLGMFQAREERHEQRRKSSKKKGASEESEEEEE